MIIGSNCTGELCKDISRYHWSLFEKRSADFDHSWQEVTDLANRTRTDLNKPTLILTGKLGGNCYSLKMDTLYKINSSISLRGGRTFASNEIVFKTVAPLRVPKERCKVTPHEGFVLETTFVINCSGWHAKNVSLLYEFRYVWILITWVCKLHFQN